MSEKIVKYTLFALLWTAVAAGIFAAVRIPISVAPQPAEPQITPLMVRFSHAAGFYEEGFELTLSANYDNTAIFYTVGGIPPDPHGFMNGTCNATKLFTEPITVESLRPRGRDLQIRVFNITAVAVRQEETVELTVSSPFTRSFISGHGVRERFGEDVLIFSLTSDPHGLYDHHEGVFVEGIDRERWYADNPGQRANPPTPANFNRRGRESERAVHVEVFDSAGNVRISQHAGMRVKGGWSRAAPRKSLELYARREYSPDTNTFNFAFFADEFDENGELIDRFRRIRLRNGGNDRDFGTLRDELSHTLFRLAGLPDTQTHTPAAVFLNGEYYGFAWLKTPRTEDHWQRRYGGKVENFEHIGDGEGDWRVLPEHWNGNPRATADWLEVVELARAGFTGSDGEARWNEFSQRVCIDNLVLYYALQVYISNEDWPGGNMEMWRYFPGDDEVGLHPFLADGRWRFIAQDLEFAWNLYGRDHAERNTIESVRTGRGQMGGRSEILDAVLNREEMRVKFAETLVELMEGAFRPDNILETLSALRRLNTAEVHAALAADLFEPGNPHWPSQGSMSGSQQEIRYFARERPEYMVRFIYESLGISVTVSGVN
jgi:hypothetical protein